MDMRNQPFDWDDILSRNEQILWHSRPDQDFGMTGGAVVGAVFGLAFAGFALFWMLGVAQGGDVFWMCGLICFAAGLAFVGLSTVGDAFVRRHTWYTLTRQRAFIATNVPIKGRKLKSCPNGGATAWKQIIGPPDTLHFATKEKRTENGSRTVPVGFMRIEDGKTAYALLRDI